MIRDVMLTTDPSVMALVERIRHNARDAWIANGTDKKVAEKYSFNLRDELIDTIEMFPRNRGLG